MLDDPFKGGGGDSNGTWKKEGHSDGTGKRGHSAWLMGGTVMALLKDHSQRYSDRLSGGHLRRPYNQGMWPSVVCFYFYHDT